MRSIRAGARSLALVSAAAVTLAFVPVAAGSARKPAGATPPPAQAANAGGQFAYAVNEEQYTGSEPGTVSIIDTESFEVRRTVRNVGRVPRGIAPVQARGKAYVANHGSAWEWDIDSRDVAVIDIAEGSPTFGTVVARVPVPGGPDDRPRPNGIAATSDGGRVFVTAGEMIFVIDVATDAVVAVLGGLEGAGQVSVAPDGREVYVAGDGAVYVIQNPSDPAEIRVSERIALEDANGAQLDPVGLAVAPDGSLLYATAFSGDRIRSVAVIDLARRALVNVWSLPLPPGQSGEDLVTSGSGRSIFMATGGGGVPALNMAVALGSGDGRPTSAAVLPPYTIPRRIDLSPDGRILAIADWWGGAHGGYFEGPGRVLFVTVRKERLVRLAGALTVGGQTVDVAFE